MDEQQQRTVEAKIEDAAACTGYPPEAFSFVLNGLSAAVRDEAIRQGTLQPQHITAECLCRKLCELALWEFSDRAEQQLGAWKIHTTHDFGILVFALVDRGLMATREGDSIAGFRDLFSLPDVIHSLRVRANEPPTKPWFQFRLFTLLLLMVLAAFAAAGYGRLGVAGSILSVQFAWLATIAVVCFWIALSDRKSKPWAPVLLGVMMLAAAAVIFYSLFVRSAFAP